MRRQRVDASKYISEELIKARRMRYLLDIGHDSIHEQKVRLIASDASSAYGASLDRQNDARFRREHKERANEIARTNTLLAHTE